MPASAVSPDQSQTGSLNAISSVWIRAGQSPPAGLAASRLWIWLKSQVDAAAYRPRAAPGIVARRLHEDNVTYYVLKNPTHSAYLKLGEQDYALWMWMDGSRTVKDLVVAFFERYQTLAFGRVSSLVDELKTAGFLVDKPTHLFQQVRDHLAQRDWTFRWRQLASAFVQREFSLRNIDPWISAMYRYGGRLLFTPLAQGLLIAVLLAGLWGFVQVLIEQRYTILATGGSYWLGLLLLGVVNFGLIVIHEHAHALTTKHFGRQVKRGGILIYYGFPAFFVDTMDIWMEPKLRRIAVTWAGPYSSLIVGGICGLAAWLLPDGLLAHLAFKAAFLCYMGALVNLNPLLELDGYFILIDWLGMPNLRERSLAFIRGELVAKLKIAFASHTSLPGRSAKSPPLFNREETIFTAFGALAAGYTLYTLVVAVYFWQTRLSRLLVELWQRPDLPSKLAAVAFGVGVVAPVVLVAGISAWSAGRGVVRQLEKRRFFESERNVALVLAAFLALLVLVPAFMGTLTWKLYVGLAPTLLLGLAVGLLVKVAQQHAGARIQATFWALAFSALLAAGGALLRPVAWQLADAWQLAEAGRLSGVPSSLHVQAMLGLEQLAALPLLVAGFQSMLEVDLRHSRRHERLAIIALLAGGFVTVIPAARWTVGQPLPVVLLAAGGPYLTLVYLATIIPTLVTYTGTRFFVPWLALVAAAGLNGALCLARLWPAWPLMQDGDLWLSLLVAGLWALGSADYLLAGLRLRPAEAHWSEDVLLSDQERLRLAFARFFATLFDTFQATYGMRRAKALDDDMDVIAVAADWDVEVNSGRINDELDLAKITIVEQADRYRDVLGRAIDLMDDWGGSTFVERATQAAYDSLPWPERETLGQYVLAGSPWGKTIAGKFDAVRSQRYHLLQQVPLLSSCNNRSLALILAAIKSEHLPAGVLLGQQGSNVTRFVIVQSGAVEKWIKAGEAKTPAQLAGVMRRGASLGSEAFMGGGTYTGTYRTAVATDILFLTLAECEQLRRAGVKLATEVGQLLAIRQLLGRMPLFASMGPQQLDGLAHHLGHRELEAGEVIVRQGEERHHFYIIAIGQVQISVTDPEGQERLVAQLGPGEHFGESALFADVPYSATCRAVVPTSLLTLDEKAFDTMVGSSMHMTHYVEQVSSGRVIDTRRKLSLAGIMG